VTRVLFISGTGTGVGKTWVTRGLARALVRDAVNAVAIKPIETGCDSDPADAVAIATACRRPELASAPGLYRARAPLAPWAATLEGEPPASLASIVTATRALLSSAEIALVEGAGGLLVPLDATSDMADLALALDAELVLVGEDRLGVLSHVLTAAAAARARSLAVRAVILSRHAGADASRPTNARILAERLGCPVVPFPPAPDDDDALADAASEALAALRLPAAR